MSPECVRYLGGVVWPPLVAEIGDWAGYLRGRIVNAGAGARTLDFIEKGQVFNVDLLSGLHNGEIHCFADLADLPFADETVDSVICNAVLEHVPDFDGVLVELTRVVKAGGYLYVGVPFLQPEHLDPEDYWRFTKSGLRRALERNGLTVVAVEPLHSPYHTVGWILQEWLTSRHTLVFRVVRRVLFPFFRRMCVRSSTVVPQISSGYRALARKAARDGATGS